MFAKNPTLVQHPIWSVGDFQSGIDRCPIIGGILCYLVGPLAHLLNEKNFEILVTNFSCFNALLFCSFVGSVMLSRSILNLWIFRDDLTYQLKIQDLVNTFYVVIFNSQFNVVKNLSRREEQVGSCIDTFSCAFY